MRALRIGLGLVLSVAVMAIWHRRAEVIEAYTAPREPVVFRFDGFDVELTPSAEVTPSPLRVPRPPDTDQVALASIRVEPMAAPEPSIPAGTVDFVGSVADPEGPVPDATVRLEHHGVDPSTGALVVTGIDVVSDQDGRWRLDGVGGGRWRIRAFVPSLLASVEPRLAFYDGDGIKTVDLSVAPADPGLVLDTGGPEQLEVGWSGTVAVTVGRGRVDEDGIVVIDPVAGASARLNIDPGAPVRLASAAETVTAASGAATYTVVCDRLGSTTATVVVAEPVGSIPAPIPGVPATVPARSVVFTPPPCVSPPPPPDPGVDDPDVTDD